MISRRKILSRSRDELHSELFNNKFVEEDEDDTWNSKEKLYQVRIKQSVFQIYFATSAFTIHLYN